MSAVECRIYGGPYLLACRCGRALRLGDMYRAEPPRNVDPDHLVLRPIVCVNCSLRAAQ